MRQSHSSVTDIEIIEDFSATARCDEGFLRVKRLRCRNRRADGSSSPVYRVDVVDRPRLDAVSVLVYRRGAAGLEVLTRMNLRPAAYFRKDQRDAMTVPDPGAGYLRVEEIVAGLLEPEDKGEEGLRRRAAEEVREEAGYAVRPEDIQLLGGSFFLAPGILSEKVFPSAVDVTDVKQEEPEGDGSPLEEGTLLQWRTLQEVLDACRRGDIPDAKTEVSLTRLLARLG
ncbi:NUDIX hydrolase [Myxococcus sp. CA051A]|uniref:NUDIX hydrolase n=1 Tax=Myxococcus llanfairpwllgwyngyllgogerychwyrndrobwllllantysiliogogogochensis TaxID=2590453 RepID=A0A540WX23_9BACT|nr:MULTISPECIES: NUDIX hydrolase [Myxococcus]NTX04043.1 NUDIX hydrolase [Myxococcus sp. CA040A]NTX13345.1 NUDIX hydrolase [Myxococcus sp. CA056]NTX61805.1 NUDIX hydrolase [Myxococcus sp. CA051A]TQF13565.1 NUDIX hydrolase [Myxococcus llanfairpwllgwyngyllgogerychwyrndrobwllllantysiliogogogochensis]